MSLIDDDTKGFSDSFKSWIVEHGMLDDVESSFHLLIHIAKGGIDDSKSSAVQLKAIQILLEAIYGKPPQADFLSSSDGVKNVNVKFEQ